MVRSILGVALAFCVLTAAAPVQAQEPPTTAVNKLGIDQDVRSGMKVLQDEILAGTLTLPDLTSPTTTLDMVPQVQLRGSNTQANAPSGDNIQVFTGFRPFVHATQSEVSPRRSGRTSLSATTTRQVCT